MPAISSVSALQEYNDLQNFHTSSTYFMGVNPASLLNHFIHNSSQKPKTLPTNTKALSDTVLTHLRSGCLQKAVSIVFSSPVPFPFSLYAQLFKICSLNLAIVEARKVESHLVTFCPAPPTFLLNRAIETYSKCGSLRDARELFGEMHQKDGGSWNAMITAYVQSGCAEKALSLFGSMQKSGISANEITFASALGSCAKLLTLFPSRQIHGLIVRYGFGGNVILKSSLVDIYGKCWDISDARKMFDEIQSPNAISWNVIVRRYLEVGDGKEAVFMFFKMFEANVSPLTFTFSSALKACSSISALKEGAQIHGIVIRIGFENDEVIFSSIVDMYVKCGDLTGAHRIFDGSGSKNLIAWTSVVSGYAISGRTGEARELFNNMPERNVISWNAMLAGYTRSFQWEEGLELVCQMLETNIVIDSVTLGLILNVSSGLSDVQLGKQVHGFVYRRMFFSNLLVGNALLDMYGKCGNLRSARVWFCQMSQWRDRVSWNALLASYARHKLSEEAMAIFSDMQWETTPSKFTFGILLAACANIFALKLGKQIHGYMVRNGYEIDVVVRGALIDMYSKCRCLEYALTIFSEAGLRDIILWNSMVLGCCHNQKGRKVLELFDMMEKEGVKPDHITFQGILLACISEGLVDLGRVYFDSMSNQYCIIPRLEHYECMIELYGRHGVLNDLEDFLKGMPFDPTVPMLSKILDACREHGYLKLGEWAAKRLDELNPPIPF